MAEYIEKEELLKRIKRMNGMGGIAVLLREDVENAINNAPTADVEEVVRCKDCFQWSAFMNDNDGKWIGDCKLVGDLRNEDDFCSCAERKENQP